MLINYKDMSELLESDKNAMSFYNSLPISLQQKMYQGGVGAFVELYNAASSKPSPIKGITPSQNAASVSEYTGAVPSGSSLDPAQRRSYGEILTSQSMPDRRNTAESIS